MGATSTLWLSIFSALIFGGIAYLRREKVTQTQVRFIFPRACARVASLCFMLASLSMFPVGVVITISAASSFIELSIFARKRNEDVRTLTYLFSAVGMFGIFLVSREQSAGAFFSFDIELLIPICGTLISAYSKLLWRDSAHTMHPIHNLAILHTWTAILSVPVILILSLLTPTQILPTSNIVALTCIVVFAGIGDVLFLRSQLHTTITINAIFSPCTPVFASLFALVVMHQHLAWWQWTGLFIVVSSVSLSTITAQRKRPVTALQPYFPNEVVPLEEQKLGIA